jgi:hypothetical protein
LEPEVNFDKYRSIPFYFINTVKREELTLSSISASMQQIKSQGFGGIVVFNKPPDGFSAEEYLGDFWFEVTENFIIAGRELGLQIWINDGFNFPPGDAGGRIAKIDPGLKQRTLHRDKQGKIFVKELDWGFPAFEEPESSRLFIALVYEEYKKRLGKYFGNGLDGIFSDADNRRLGPLDTNRLDGQKHFPWSRDFASLFQRRFNYDIMPHLEDVLSERGGNVCCDYWQFAEELYHSWFKNNYEWCKANKLKYTFHTSDTGPFTRDKCARSSIYTEGKFLDLAACCDYPGTDHELLALDGGTHFDKRYFVPAISYGGTRERLINHDFYNSKYDLRAKYAAGAAFMHGKERVMCEAFAATNWGATFCELRKIATWQIMQGINFFVPHAVHHRLAGAVKYFAPPEFSHSTLKHGVREFNDFMAKYSAISAQSEYIPQIAVLDPTSDIWRKTSEGGNLFTLCDKLNRLPYNYHIVDRQFVEANPGKFKVVIESDKDFDLNTLGQILGNDIAFSAQAPLHYRRCRLSDGTMFLMLANVWNDNTVTGTLTWGSRSVDVELCSGEIAVIGGEFEEFRSPGIESNRGNCLKQLSLPLLMAVKFELPNIIPLWLWQDSSGKPATIDKGGDDLFLRWENAEELSELKLKVPAFLEGELFCDNRKLTAGTAVRLFDDEYIEFNLENGHVIGKHELRLSGGKRTREIFFNSIYLTGDFNLEIDRYNEFHRPYFKIYSLNIHVPEKINIRLSRRADKLDINKSLCEQGHIFYSGGTTYIADIEINNESNILALPDISGICEIAVDGKFLARPIWNPYRFELGHLTGKHRLEITVYNTFGNMLEGYQAR